MNKIRDNKFNYNNSKSKKCNSQDNKKKNQKKLNHLNSNNVKCVQENLIKKNLFQPVKNVIMKVIAKPALKIILLIKFWDPIY